MNENIIIFYQLIENNCQLMRSTLPELFWQKKVSLPKRQGGIFELDLNLEDQKQYRTKFVKPQSSQNDDGRNNHKTFFRKRSLNNNRYDHSSRKQVSLSYDAKHVDLEPRYGQEIDNAKFIIRKVEKQIEITKISVQDFISDKNLLQSQLQDFNQRRSKAICSMESQMMTKINALRQKLSTLRRESGMGIKKNKKGINYINEELIDTCAIMKDIENKRSAMKNENFLSNNI